MKYIKTYEGFTFNTPPKNSVSTMLNGGDNTIPDDIKNIVEDRLSPIADIMDEEGRRYDIVVNYFIPALNFSNNWSSYILQIEISKDRKTRDYLNKVDPVFDISEVSGCILDLISHLKAEYGLIFNHYNLKNKLNQVVSDVDSPKISYIENGFKNLEKEEKYSKTSRLFLGFEKKYIPDEAS